MLQFIASLVVSTLITIYLIFSYYIVSLASSISYLFGVVVFIIALAVAIDILTTVSKK